MNSDTIKGDWKKFVGKAEETWGKLTGDAGTETQGNLDQLHGHFQKGYGVTREAFDKFKNDWNTSNDETTTTTSTTTTTKTTAA